MHPPSLLLSLLSSFLRSFLLSFFLSFFPFLPSFLPHLLPTSFSLLPSILCFSSMRDSSIISSHETSTPVVSLTRIPATTGAHAWSGSTTVGEGRLPIPPSTPSSARLLSVSRLWPCPRVVAYPYLFDESLLDSYPAP